MTEMRTGNRVVEILDRVLDKGVIIDAHVRIGVAGIEVIAVEARVVVASISTYLVHAEAIAWTAPAARPRLVESAGAEAAGGVPAGAAAATGLVAERPVH